MSERKPRDDGRAAVYVITNRINGKNYIGVSIDPDRRWNEHRTESKRSELPLYRSMRKYGIDNFTLKILYWAKDFKTALELETFGRACGIGDYNMTDGGEGTLGRIPSQQQREKVAAKLRGRITPPDVRVKQSFAKKGKPIPHQEKMHAAQRGVKRGPRSKEVVEKTAAKLRGRKQSPESNAKRSQTLANKSPEEKQEMKRKQIESQTKYPTSVCHPGKPNMSGGLCQTCYMRKRRSEGKNIHVKKAAMCHPDKKAHSRGLCWSCWKKVRENETPTINLSVPILSPTVAGEGTSETATTLPGNKDK